MYHYEQHHYALCKREYYIKAQDPPTPTIEPYQGEQGKQVKAVADRIAKDYHQIDLQKKETPNESM